MDDFQGRTFVVAAFATVALSCGSQESLATSTVAAALSAGDANVMGFENTADWTPSAGTVVASTTRTQGNFSLAFAPRQYAELRSRPLTTLTAVSDTLALDVQLPTAQPNPFWFGQIMMYIECPSRGIYNQYLDQRPLTGLTPGQFHTLRYPVPAQTVEALRAGCSDLRFKVALSVPFGTQSYLLDDLRFESFTHQLDAFVYRDLRSCAIGNPCSGDNCLHFFQNGPDPGTDADDIVRVAFQKDADLLIVKPDDPRIATAVQSHCFSLGMDAAESAEVQAQIAGFVNNVATWTGGAINMRVVVHEIAGPTPAALRMAEGSPWLGPDEGRETIRPLVSRATDFVVVSHGVRDLATGLRTDVDRCGNSFGASLGIFGTGYSWVPKTGRALPFECADSTTYTFEVTHQIRYGLHELSGYQDLYIPSSPPASCPFFPNTPSYPACGRGASNPRLWFPDHEICASDPDYVRCGGVCDMPEFLEHVYRAHWNPGQLLIVNHCKDGVRDCSETGVDSGGECL